MGLATVAALAGAIALSAVALLPTRPGILPVAAADGAVRITDGAFEPGSVTVTQGDVVTWTNAGTEQHTVTADDGSFDSGPLSSGDVFGNLFDAPGTFTYHDTHDPTMKGTVVVKAAKPTPTANGTPVPTPPPGTLPPNFRTLPPLPTPTPTTSSAESLGPVISPSGSAGGPSDGSGSPERPVLLLVVSVIAGIASLGLWIAGRRQDTPTG